MAIATLPVISPDEIEILRQSRTDPNIFCDYFLRKPGQEHGWLFDSNFDDAGKWQKAMTLAQERFFVCIAGIATGKTLGVAMAASYHCMITARFKFLNIAGIVWQSMLMYTAFLEQIEGTPLERFIIEKPRRPHPKVTIGYRVGDYSMTSTMEFMSIGEGGDASNIFSWRGDWINIDEAGQIGDTSKVVSHLVTRLTGVSAEGRPFVGRLSITSNPWDNPDLWMLADMAARDPNSVLINVDTAMNKNVTDAQIDTAMKLIPEADKQRFMSGKRPQGKGSYFAESAIMRCENEESSRILDNLVESKDPDTVYIDVPVLGPVHVEMPRQDGRIYMAFVDPGTLAPPARNSPVIMVFDVTYAPAHVSLVAFWWGNGGGSIYPMIDKFLELLKKYKPLLAGMDSTSTQKYTAEMITADHIAGKNYSIESVIPLDFSGTKLHAYLVSLRLALEARMFSWPSSIIAIGSQLRNYVASKDKKLAQDIVAALAMAAFTIRAVYPAEFEDTQQEDKQNKLKAAIINRGNRETDGGRTAIYRSGNARPS